MQHRTDVPAIDRDALIEELHLRLPDASLQVSVINPDYGLWEIDVRDPHHRVTIAWGPLSGFGATDLDNIRDDISPFLSHDWPLESADAAVAFVVGVVKGSSIA